MYEFFGCYYCILLYISSLYVLTFTELYFSNFKPLTVGGV